jgi:hypothetical protein
MQNVASGNIFNPETSCQVEEANSKTKLSVVYIAFKPTHRERTEECTVDCRHIILTL